MTITTINQPIQMRDYWMGRDAQYPALFSTDIQAHGMRTVALANDLLEIAAMQGVYPSISDSGFGVVNSGWRPPDVNASKPGAAKTSNHIQALAIDIDDNTGELDEWLMDPAGQDAIAKLGLWMEHPSATKGWCHIQIVPQASFARTGRRVYYP